MNIYICEFPPELKVSYSFTAMGVSEILAVFSLLMQACALSQKDMSTNNKLLKHANFSNSCLSNDRVLVLPKMCVSPHVK